MTKERRDVSTDPRLDEGTEADWAAEGGALPEGPAIDPDDREDDSGDDSVSLADSDAPEDR
jgi:hypothetical protein